MTNRIVELMVQSLKDVLSGFNALVLPPEPLASLKGKRGETPLFYAQLDGKQGIYFIFKSQAADVPVYVGRTEGRTTERGLADRLWGHLESNSDVRIRLKEDGINLDECFVATLIIPDRAKRNQLEHFAIGIFGPKANVG